LFFCFAPAQTRAKAKNKGGLMLKSFRTYQLALQFYKEAKGLRLKTPLRDQYQRALLSILLNLSEGSAKPTAKDRRRFYFIALGSWREIQTILLIQEEGDLYKKCDVLAAHLYRLCHRS